MTVAETLSRIELFEMLRRNALGPRRPRLQGRYGRRRHAAGFRMPLPTWVPSERPRELAVTLHGDYHFFAPLSADDTVRGMALRKERYRRGLFLFACAKACGLSTAQYCELERGVRRFDLRQAYARLAEVMPGS